MGDTNEIRAVRAGYISGKVGKSEIPETEILWILYETIASGGSDARIFGG